MYLFDSHIHFSSLRIYIWTSPLAVVVSSYFLNTRTGRGGAGRSLAAVAIIVLNDIRNTTLIYTTLLGPYTNLLGYSKDFANYKGCGRRS